MPRLSARRWLWCAMLLWLSAAQLMANGTVLRVQVVLTATSSKLAIAPATADKVAEHIKALVPNIVVRTPLVSSERIVLNFECENSERAAMEDAINGLSRNSFASLVSVQDKKFEVLRGVPIASPPVDTKGPTKTIKGLEIGLEPAGKTDLLSISAQGISLGELLAAIARVIDFSYVCSGNTAAMVLEIKVSGVHLEELLTALKTALSLSVKKVGSLYVISSNDSPAQ